MSSREPHAAQRSVSFKLLALLVLFVVSCGDGTTPGPRQPRDFADTLVERYPGAASILATSAVDRAPWRLGPSGVLSLRTPGLPRSALEAELSTDGTLRVGPANTSARIRVHRAVSGARAPDAADTVRLERGAAVA